MKVFMVNKYLYPKGGAETYVRKLGAYLVSRGHEVQYFGMEHKGRCLGNRVGAYASEMDFRGRYSISKLTYPVRTVYSWEAGRKIRLVLDDFKPDVVHLNNFTYHLTPSILLEIQKWKKQSGRACRTVFTAHDFNLICPNHMLNNPNMHQNCGKCLGGHFIHCVKGRCIHGSMAKSMVGTMEATLWNAVGVYRHIDAVICCSEFMKRKMDSNPVFRGKTVTMHNFMDFSLGGSINRSAVLPESVKYDGVMAKSINRSAVLPESVNEDVVPDGKGKKKDYVLYFGRFSQEKGICTLLKACRALPGIPFVFAGAGLLEDEISHVPNITNVGFQSGDGLKKFIREARFSVCPSEWYENCPFSVIESLMLGTPVLAADIGGIPELLEDGVTGELFESGSVAGLKDKIWNLWNDRGRLDTYSRNCKDIHFDTLEEYTEKLMKIYRG